LNEARQKIEKGGRVYGLPRRERFGCNDSSDSISCIMKAVAEAKQEAQGYQSDGRGLDDRTCSHSEFDMCSSLSHI
jgi:hypothetical protein